MKRRNLSGKLRRFKKKLQKNPQKNPQKKLQKSPNNVT